MVLQPDIELNVVGLRCPEPIMALRKAIRNMTFGQIILIIADDPATVRDVPHFCLFMDHVLLGSEVTAPPYRYWIAKGSSCAQEVK